MCLHRQGKVPQSVRERLSAENFEELKLREPGEAAIIFDPESGIVEYCDLPSSESSEIQSLHFTDIVDAKRDKDVHWVTSMAMSRAEEMVESDVAFRGEKVHLRVKYSLLPKPRVSVFIKSPRV